MGLTTYYLARGAVAVCSLAIKARCKPSDRVTLQFIPRQQRFLVGLCPSPPEVRIDPARLPRGAG